MYVATHLMWVGVQPKRLVDINVFLPELLGKRQIAMAHEARKLARNLRQILAGGNTVGTYCVCNDV